jgi:antitoxin component YwqK of YwqJK toxin-antitoxin module
MSLFSCKTKKDGSVTIEKKDFVNRIILPQTDSSRLEIILNEDHSIKSVTRYSKSEFNGEQLSFHRNGRVAKKFEAWENVYHGHYYEFYESGAIAADNFFCNSYPCNYAAEYWDGPFGIMKKSIHYGDKGKIDRIRLFDTLGNFIKDSVPLVQ